MTHDYDTLSADLHDLEDALRVLLSRAPDSRSVEVTVHNVPLSALTPSEAWELRAIGEGDGAFIVAELEVGQFTIAAYLED